MPAKQPGVLRKLAYTDLAMTPVGAHEVETHELFQSVAAKAYVDQQRHLKIISRVSDKAAPAPVS